LTDEKKDDEINLINTIFCFIKTLQNISDSIVQVITPYAEPFKKFQKFCEENKSELSQFIIDIITQLQKVNNYLSRDLFEKLIKYGWVLPDSLPISVAGGLFRKIEEADLKIVDEQIIFDDFFINEFSSNNWEYLSDIYDDWENNKKIKQERLNIIKDCLFVIKNPDCKNVAANVVIPTLIAQIEGLICDKFGDKCSLKDNLNNQLEEVAKYMLYDTLFKYSKYGDLSNLKDPSLSRNKILHGEYTEYGKVENIIKLFLLIEIIVNTQITDN
jgi:hypothetical protein